MSNEQNNSENMKIEESLAETKATEPTPKKAKPPGILSIIQSVLAAMFGVQSDAKREQDFESGYIGNYIFVGILFVIVFIFSIISLVNTILEP